MKRLFTLSIADNAISVNRDSKKLLKDCLQKKRFKATTDFPKALKSSDVVILCVPTPLSQNNQPNLDFLENACRMLSKNSLKNKLIVIESSIPPGTTRNLVVPILKRSHYEPNKDFWVVYIPERLAPGQAIEEIAKTARIVGAFDTTGSEIARALYKSVIKNEIVVTDVSIAETSKLVENTYRDVNIAFANEIAQICEQLKIDAMEVIRVANTHPRVHVHTPGIGVGGPCIPKDPHLLISPFQGISLNLQVIPKARDANVAMPGHFVNLIKASLLKQGKSLKNSNVLCLGISYKANVSDSRDTPAEPVIRSFLKHGANVFVYDPNSPETFGAKRSKSVFEHMKTADVVAILTDHDEFKKIPLNQLKKSIKPGAIIADGKRMIPSSKAKELKLNHVAVGLG